MCDLSIRNESSSSSDRLTASVQQQAQQQHQQEQQQHRNSHSGSSVSGRFAPRYGQATAAQLTAAWTPPE